MLGKESDQHPHFISRYRARYYPDLSTVMYISSNPVNTLSVFLKIYLLCFVFFSEHTKSASHSRDRWGSSWDNQCFTITKQGVSNR